MTDRRRLTPGTDSVLGDPRLSEAASRLGPALLKKAALFVLARCRAGEIPPESVVAEVLAALPPSTTSMHKVVNATGIIVHTNLGRSPLSEAAIQALSMVAGATDLEFDLSTGVRDQRGESAVSALLSCIPDAEAVHLVNNGAAALALVACTMAAGKEIIVARGEMVEIGDGFRIPELIESVGARLREVGTTNRVHLADYSGAINETTALILKVHPSNFVVSGFTSTVSAEQLSSLPVPVVVDIGSGLLEPHPRLPNEPNMKASLLAGVDLVTSSGDKLLGGPQCGLIVGRKKIVDILRKHPLSRALRVDKLTLAALEATLTGPLPPTLVSLATTPEQLLVRARSIASELTEVVAASAVQSRAAVGGGGAPAVTIPSAAVSLPSEFAVPLRTGDRPVVGRIEHDQLLLDLIAIPSTDDNQLVEVIRAAVSAARG